MAAFPSNLPPLPGYEGTRCGGRHGAITYADTYSDGRGHRVCKYCDEIQRGVVPPERAEKIKRDAKQGRAYRRIKDRALVALGRRPRRDSKGRWVKRKVS